MRICRGAEHPKLHSRMSWTRRELARVYQKVPQRGLPSPRNNKASLVPFQLYQRISFGAEADMRETRLFQSGGVYFPPQSFVLEYVTF